MLQSTLIENVSSLHRVMTVNSTFTATNGQTYTVTLYQDLAALPARFEALFRQAAAESLFHALPWYRNFIDAGVVPKERMRIYAVDKAGNPPAARAVLLMQDHDTRAGLAGARTLAGLANYYSPLFGPIVAADSPDVQETLDALASAFIRDDISWDIIDLHPLTRDTPVHAALFNALRKSGLLVDTYFCAANWYLKVGNQSYNEYLGTRTSRLSKTGKRSRRILETGGQYRYQLFTSSDGLERAIADYNVIYESSWKIPEPYPEFVAGLIRTCAEHGWLRLGVAYMDGEPAAAQIWIVADGTASIYKVAYDERYAKQSVGTVLSSVLMEHVIEKDKVEVVDYLTGDDSYKRDWMSDRRERWGIVAYNPRTPRGLLAAARHFGARAAGRVIEAARRIRKPAS